MTNILEKLFSVYTILIWKLQGMKFSGKSSVRYGVDIPRLKRKVWIGKRTNLDRGVSLILTETEENQSIDYLIKLGDKVYINRYSIIDATIGITIGDETMIGSGCYITDHDHVFQGFSAETPIGALPLKGVPTVIENNVWIGSNVTILKGVKIGKNAIIGAGSIVTKDVESGAIAVGNPCKKIGTRNT